jgi:hypothetical protein
MNTFAILCIQIEESYQKHRNWRSVGDEFGISKAVAHAIGAYQREPKDPHIRVHLGLPALVEIPACDKCGEGHTVDWCTRETPAVPKKKKAKRQPKKWWNWDTDDLRDALKNREVMGL